MNVWIMFSVTSYKLVQYWRNMFCNTNNQIWSERASLQVFCHFQSHIVHYDSLMEIWGNCFIKNSIEMCYYFYIEHLEYWFACNHSK
jgi:hypothetical protein